jgi:hypothetical protein
MGRLDDIDLKVNPEPRAACLLLLDTSGSMDGARIAELQEGLRVLQFWDISKYLVLQVER